jgi:hypothetical protein
MSKSTEVLTNLLVPSYARRCWTFRNATLVAIFAAIASACVRGFVRFPPEYVARMESYNPFHSPAFVGLYYVFVAVVLGLVYATRNHTTWYQWRVWVFGMFLAGGLIGVVDLLLPLHSG